MAVTIKQLAKACGVSTSTVSYVLNGGPRPISAATRARVEEAMRRLDYRPSAVARGLASKRMNTIGVVTDFWAMPNVNSYFASVLHGILMACKRAHQSTMVFMTDSDFSTAPDLSSYTDGRCDGLLLLELIDLESVVSGLRQRGFPFVLVNRTSADPETPWVDIDNVAAAEQAVGYLIAHGHRRIAVLGGDSGFQSAHDRLAGYRQALAAAGIAVDERLIWPGTYSDITGEERALQLAAWPRAERPTALFCCNDGIAIGAMRGLKRIGVRVPEEISVVGIDDVPEAATCSPALTTIRQPLQTIGEVATQRLLAQVEAQPDTAAGTILPTELIIRNSVRAI